MNNSSGNTRTKPKAKPMGREERRTVITHSVDEIHGMIKILTDESARLRARNIKLESEVRRIGQMTNTCTKDILGEVCPGCHCGKVEDV